MSKPAPIWRRLLAAFIDSLIGSFLFFVPIVGGIFGLLYILSKDAIMYRLTGYPQWKNKSIGKKLLGLKLEKKDGTNWGEGKESEGNYTVDIKTSAWRNLTLAPGRAVRIIPLLGWVLGPIVGAIFKLIELIVLTSDPEGIRLGDRLVGTIVVMDGDT